MSRRAPPVGELPQRVLALELRYAIDLERRQATAAHFEQVRSLISSNPYGVTSRHVHHNLGVERLDWLRRVKLLPDNLSQENENMVEPNKELQKKAADPKATAVKGTVTKTDVGSGSLRDAARKSVEKESK